MFAASPDHRLAPPLSYAELLEYSEQAAGGTGGGNASAGGSAINSSSGRGVGDGRRGGAAGSTGSASRCVPQDKNNRLAGERALCGGRVLLLHGSPPCKWYVHTVFSCFGGQGYRAFVCEAGCFFGRDVACCMFHATVYATMQLRAFYGAHMIS